MARLGEHVKIRTGKLDANASSINGMYPFFTCSKTPLQIDTYSYDCECVLVAGNGDLNVKYYSGKFDAYQRTYIIESCDVNVLSVRYLYYFLDKYIEVLREQSIGGVIKYIKLNNLTDAIIPLPPLSEQCQIVKNMEYISKLISLRHQQLAKLDELVKARFVEMFGDLANNEFQWRASTIGQECHYIKDGPHKSPPYVDEEHGIPFISTRNIVSGDGIDWSTAKYISEKDYQDCIKKCNPQKGDILYSKGGTTGIAKLVDTDRPFANWVHVAVLKFGNTLDGKFFESMLNSDYCYSQSQYLTKGIANKDFVLSAIAQVKIVVPPLEKQKQYALFVREIEKSKLTIQQSLAKLEVVKKALMQEYFG